ncbi:uncharacterized protein [Amphiura filiformis]|uniref:uncharacterized protein n=1 Tax=Amphiura filiformis TaxID=82378 RepID=UPI003B21FD2D
MADVVSESSPLDSASGYDSEHEYLGGKGRKPSLRKSNRLADHDSTSSESDNKHDKDNTESDTSNARTSASSGTVPLKFDANMRPHFKMLEIHGYGKLGIRAIQSTRDGQLPMLVGCIQKEGYKPDPLPDDIIEVWTQIKEAVTEVLKDLKWIEDSHYQYSFKDLDYPALLKKYPLLTDDSLTKIEYIKSGFLNPGHHMSPMANGLGRVALDAIFTICREVLRCQYPHEYLARKFQVLNIGGRSGHFTDSCIIATFEDKEDRSEIAALKFLGGCKLPDPKKKGRKYPKDVHMYVPDTVVHSACLPKWIHSFIAGEVKSDVTNKEEEPEDDTRQAWIQALIGLSKGTSDASYGVLIKPTRGIIFELHIESRDGKEHKRLATKSKIWKFTREDSILFQVNDFCDFMCAITSIMLKYKNVIIKP